MLTIYNEENTQARFLEAMKFAAENNCLNELISQLNYLNTYADARKSEGFETECILYKDFAPLSFTFQMRKRWRDGTLENWFHGGLIYSGPGQPLDGSAPALTVSLEKSTNKHTWSVHT